MDGPRPPRASEAHDLAKLIAHVFDFFRDQFSLDLLQKQLSQPARMRNTRVIVEDGRPVSHIFLVYDHLSLLGCRVKVGSVSSVCTYPEYRGRGFASTILAQSFAEMKAAGARIVIISGDRGIYHRAHCVPAGHLLQTLIHPDSLPAPCKHLSIRQAGPDDSPTLARLHQTEPVRFLRTADRFARLCAHWADLPPQLWLIHSKDTPLAYLLLGPLWTMPRARSRDVCEYAGSRAAIVSALPLLLKAAGLNQLALASLGHDRELSFLLSGPAAVLKPTTLPGTHGLLDLPGLMRDMRPYLAARLPRADLRPLSFDQQGDTCTFALGQQRLDLDPSQAVRLVLGSPDAPSVRGELGRVLSQIFPLPMPLPGFNAV